MTKRVVLTWPELTVGATVGTARHMWALKQGRKDRHGYEGDGYGPHILGAQGEMAFCKSYGIYWHPTMNTFRAQADVGDGIEIKTRSEDHYDLLVRPDDHFDRVFVLVTGKGPAFVLRGWMYGEDCRRDEWWKDYGNREPAWFAPQASLQPLSTLPLRLGLSGEALKEAQANGRETIAAEATGAHADL